MRGDLKQLKYNEMTTLIGIERNKVSFEIELIVLLTFDRISILVHHVIHRLIQ